MIKACYNPVPSRSFLIEDANLPCLAVTTSDKVILVLERIPVTGKFKSLVINEGYLFDYSKNSISRAYKGEVTLFNIGGGD